jgi:hypothetical protein
MKVLNPNKHGVVLMFETLTGLVSYHNNLLKDKTDKEKLYIKKVVKKTMVEDLDYVSFKLFVNKRTLNQFIINNGINPPDIFDLNSFLTESSLDFLESIVKKDYNTLVIDITSWNLLCINKSFLFNENPYIKIRATYACNSDKGTA